MKLNKQNFRDALPISKPAACWPAALVSQRMKSCRLQRSLQSCKGKRGEEHWRRDTTYLLNVPSWLVNRQNTRTKQCQNHGHQSNKTTTVQITTTSLLFEGTAGSGCGVAGHSQSLTCDALVDAAHFNTFASRACAAQALVAELGLLVTLVCLCWQGALVLFLFWY